MRILSAMAELPAQISLSFPGRPEYLRLARLTAADAGSRAGFDYEEIDDLRIAVSELCHVIGGTDSDDRLTLEFTIEPGSLEVRGTSAIATSTHDNEFSRAIVAAVVDDHEVDAHSDGSTRFWMVKRSAVPADR